MSQSISLRRILAYACLVFALTVQPLSVVAQSAEPEAVATTEPTTSESTPSSESSSQPPAAPVEPEKTYTYNDTTGRWDSDKWTYNPLTKKYEATPTPEPIIQNVPVESAESASSIEATNTTEIENKLDSSATSGSAVVTKNTLAADATSGDAAATATIINSVNSTMSSSDNTKAATFVADVMGDVHGDIMLKPMLLKAMLEAEAAEATSTSATLKNTSTLTNDINLSAISGDASVTKNTTAGSATTGSANTVANVVNIVNSMIAANRSFVGTVNIYGNLDGDILIAPDFIPQLLASNAVPHTTGFAPAKNLVVDAENTQTILNNIDLNAMSGQAIVDGNTAAGSATTGSAQTNTVIFNMTGHEVVAKNSLLVFVNVLGRWVGVIVDAPTGATSAVIGNGVTKSVAQAPDIAITAENDVQIINNLTLRSLTGDAVVAGNTTAGDARTGDATASANIANITNSQFGLSDWFGVLYINVFGNWFGSLGIDTVSGSTPVSPVQSGLGQPQQPIEFVPRGSRAVSAARIVPLLVGQVMIESAQPFASNEGADTAVLAAQIEGGSSGSTSVASDSPRRDSGLSLIAALSFVAGMSLLVSSFVGAHGPLRLGRRSSTVA